MSKSTFKGRIGGVMRRTSSVFAISRPNTPQSDSEHPADQQNLRRKSSSSLERRGSTLDTKSAPHVATPSPIAESPARELAALAPDTAVGPSPLANAVRPDTPPPEPKEAPKEEEPPAQSTTGAQMTDEPRDMFSKSPPPPENNEEAPKPDAPKAPSIAAEEAKPSRSQTPAPEVKQISRPPSVPPAHSDKGKEKETTAAPQISEPPPNPKPEVSSSAPDPPPATSAGAPSYFDLSPHVESPTPTVPFQRTLSDNPWGPEALANHPPDNSNPYQTDSEDAHQDNTRSLGHKKSDASFYGNVLTGQDRTVNYQPSNPSLRGGHVPESRVIQLSRKPSKASVASSGRGKYDHARYVPSVGHTESTGYGHSKPPSVKKGDPSADHSYSAPSNQISRQVSLAPADAPAVPPERLFYDQQSPVDTRNQMAALAFPMASFTDLLDKPAGYTVDENVPQDRYLQNGSAAQPREMPKPETNENTALLSSVLTPPGARSYVQPSTSSRVPPAVSPQTGNGTHWPTNGPRLNTLGWIEYNLPDSSIYYVHPTLKVTTDINLRDERKLDAVMLYFERKEVTTPPGWEMWLRDTSSARNGFVPLRCWVDHKKKTVVYDGPIAQSGPPNVISMTESDRLDMEYRYWCFIEAHPAHIALHPTARAEAIDALTWSYTDRLLPSQRISVSPFSQEECQDLMKLLRSFDSQTDGVIQSVVHTRIVSRILLRLSHWRQANFRPNKPLPQDAARNGLRPNRVPFHRTVVDFVVSCLFLGVPLAFSSRQNYHRDHESGARGPGSLLMIGACTCLVAAIVLSASVTFLSLPGLESVARIAGFVAILCATASMASAVVVVLRCKAEMDGSSPVLTFGEGLTVINQRSLSLSLPIVFLGYGTIAFIIGMVAYSVKGISLQNIGLIKLRFDDLTRWALVGSIGGVAGVLVTLALVG